MKIKKIGVVTTGGDAPGMNAAIRSVVRTAIFNGLEVAGIERGWEGLISGDLKPMDARSVSNILNRGGTILKTLRSPDFREKKSRERAYANLRTYGVDALVVIGGDGSLAASSNIFKENGTPCVVIPATIDNDLGLTDYTIGFDTAVNTAVDAIDKIRDTATSHERVFIVEIMGREHGFLALEVGLVCGAEMVLIPEKKFKVGDVVKALKANHKKGKSSSIIVMAEGAGDSSKLAKEISGKTGLDVRVSVLGHMQRGGCPSATSRNLASRFGEAAVELIVQKKFNRMVGIASNKITSWPIQEVLSSHKKIDLDALRLVDILAI